MAQEHWSDHYILEYVSVIKNSSISVVIQLYNNSGIVMLWATFAIPAYIGPISAKFHTYSKLVTHKDGTA